MALKFNPLTGQMEDDVMDAANPAAPAQPFQPESTQPMNPMVRDYLSKKFNLGDFTNENRQKLMDESAPGLGDKFGAALAAIGAGFMGKDAAAAGQAKLNAAKQAQKDKLDAFDKGRANTIENYRLDKEATTDAQTQDKLAREMDPTSEESKMAQDLAKSMGYTGDTSKLTAAQFKDFSPALQKKYEIAEKALDRQERSKDRALQRESMMSQRDLARQDKQEKEAKLSDKQVDAISSYDKALDSIKSIRAGKSTQDTGPLAGRTNSVAQMFGVDDAKTSAFRSEVQDQLAQYIKSISGGAVSDSERASLLQNLPNMNDNDETFNKKLDALEARLQRARQTDLDNLSKQGKNTKAWDQAAPAPKEETKVVGGKTYRKVNGGWEEVE